ncbi:MAG: LytTR family DNA-binding domain-containing protein, partial [Paracoccaceae bacterium]
SGPFGTFTALSFPVRLGYWAVIVGVSILVGRVVRVTIEQRFENRPAWLVEVIALSTMVPILTAIISVLTPLLLQVSPDRLPHPGTLAVYVLGIAGFVSAVRLARRHVPAVAEVTGGAPVAPRLLDRLPREKRGEIYRLTGQDHHVEVATDRGVVTIRLRFSDAIAEMEPMQGYCTHRSHWVSHAAISGVEREPGKLFLRLVNGDRVPVSRKYRPELEKARIV